MKLCIILFFIVNIISCKSVSHSYLKIEDILGEEKKTIALVSFTFPKNMTNERLDRIKYLNTQIYVDDILNGFVSNFNKENSMLEIKPIESIIGSEEFSKLEYHSILGADYVAATGTIASNYISENTIETLKTDDVYGYLFVNANMSFWSQEINTHFEMFNLNKEMIWKDDANGVSYYIIGDTGPTRQTAYEIVLADVLENQKNHNDDLKIIIDEATSNLVLDLKTRKPYAFDMDSILFTKTNENKQK